MDPKLVSAAFGMRPEGLLIYLANSVDWGRLHRCFRLTVSRPGRVPTGSSAGRLSPSRVLTRDAERDSDDAAERKMALTISAVIGYF